MHQRSQSRPAHESSDSEATMDAGRTLAAPVVYNGGDSDMVSSYCGSSQWAVGAESTKEHMNPMMQEEMTEPSSDYTIEIKVVAGQISVSVEPADMEAEAPTEETGKSVPNIREAMKVVMDIYENAGAQPDTDMADQEMEQGFKPGL